MEGADGTNKYIPTTNTAIRTPAKMVSQHGGGAPNNNNNNNNNNKAAAILRASLNRRTDGGALHNSRHGPGSGTSGSGSGRPPVAPTSSTSHAAPAFPDVNYASDGDSVEVSSTTTHSTTAHGEESLALTDSIHGPNGITSSRSRPSSRNSLVHSGHGDIESALPSLLRAERRRSSSAHSAAKAALG